MSKGRLEKIIEPSEGDEKLTTKEKVIAELLRKHDQLAWAKKIVAGPSYDMKQRCAAYALLVEAGIIDPNNPGEYLEKAKAFRASQGWSQ